MKTDKISLDDLKEQDVYSLSLFLIYKLSAIPKMAVISELPYVLDETNLLKLCKYFGGRTIRIPTVDELNDAMKITLLYQLYRIDKRVWEEALVESGFSLADSYKTSLKLKAFETMLKEYNFEGGIFHDS